MSKPWFCFLSLLCAVSLALSLFVFVSPADSFAPHSEYTYTLKDYHGKLALFETGRTTPSEVYEIYTRLLPEQDVLHLQQGIPVQSDAELERLLEDFGL